MLQEENQHQVNYLFPQILQAKQIYVSHCL